MTVLWTDIWMDRQTWCNSIVLSIVLLCWCVKKINEIWLIAQFWETTSFLWEIKFDYVIRGFQLGAFPLKMICNDFLVVKVNCWSYVCNIMKYMWILRNVKNNNIVEKNVWKVCIDDSQVMASYQENTTRQPIECCMLTTDRATTHRHDDKCCNRFLKHKLVK